jgi:hypothetical protein
VGEVVSWDPIGTIADHLIAHAALGLAPGSSPTFGTPLTLNGSQSGSDGDFACLHYDNDGTTRAAICGERYNNDAYGAIGFSATDLVGDLTRYMRLKPGGFLDVGDLSLLDGTYTSTIAMAPTFANQTALSIQAAVGQSVDLMEVVDDGARLTTTIDFEGYLAGASRGSGFEEPLMFNGYASTDWPGAPTRRNASFCFRQDLGSGADYLMAWAVSTTTANWRDGSVAYMDTNGNLFRGTVNAVSPAQYIQEGMSIDTTVNSVDQNIITMQADAGTPTQNPSVDAGKCVIFAKEDADGVVRLFYWDGDGGTPRIIGNQDAATALPSVPSYPAFMWIHDAGVATILYASMKKTDDSWGWEPILEASPP